ncbi:hypothetical protein NGF19_14180 [Streptomyces sp. RY43-2]|uniref:AB hydrolase-1 domain-containing protein n=1 Tax=Streptomyces macrolidinus TaxID=2952607 RepID=A0ABT0ZED3_9ACTN|nr:hypothetical protein [Streptomyces macrolidinus]MCN9241923.1 hypothetical protein [Streptomyces macrolidinus]
MADLLFVHGTGVRQPAYGDTLALLRASLPAQVHDCYWGDACGVPQDVGRAALPGAGTPTEDPAPPSPEEPFSDDDRDVVLWGTLYEDPLAPLRGGPRKGTRLGDRSGPQVESRARALAAEPPEELRQLLGPAEEPFRTALTAVLDSAAAQEALTHGLGPGELPGAIATAAVAQFLGEALRRGEPVLWTTGQRDQAVAIVTGRLGGQPRGVGRTVLRASWWTAQRFGVMRAADKNRGAMMADHVHPKLGDVLKYLARGDQLRTFIRDRVAEVGRRHGPVVLLAHSLGGIAAVDLLVHEELPGVHHLVTIGSQAAHLYEIGALPSLAPGKPLPEHFPAWTNIYDRRDLLGFTAAPLFPGRVTDVELNSGQPFPAAHSAYFPNPEVHRTLSGLLQETV